jgi:hypothetical protein
MGIDNTRRDFLAGGAAAAGALAAGGAGPGRGAAWRPANALPRPEGVLLSRTTRRYSMIDAIRQSGSRDDSGRAGGVPDADGGGRPPGLLLHDRAPRCPAVLVGPANRPVLLPEQGCCRPREASPDSLPQPSAFTFPSGLPLQRGVGLRGRRAPALHRRYRRGLRPADRRRAAAPHGPAGQRFVPPPRRAGRVSCAPCGSVPLDARLAVRPPRHALLSALLRRW